MTSMKLEQRPRRQESNADDAYASAMHAADVEATPIKVADWVEADRCYEPASVRDRLKSKLKHLICKAALRRVIPFAVADWLIKVLGLRHA